MSISPSFKHLLPTFIFLISLPGLAQNSSPVVADPDMAALQVKFTQALDVATQNQLKVTALHPTAMPGIVEIELDSGEFLYGDSSGEFIFAGDMFRASAAGLQNLSAVKRQVQIQEIVASIPESEMIIFDPEVEKTSITVFTDVDCTYCRALHRDLDKLLTYGIQVRYVAYPRGGANATSIKKMISVWCSKDRKEALNYAKNGDDMPEINCDNPVMKHYALGNQIGIQGTPALVFPDGTLVPGYVEADRLAAMLNVAN